MTAAGTPRSRRPRALAALLLATLLVAAAALPAPARSTAPTPRAAAPALVVSPTSYVAGQALTWTGSVGVAGVRPFVLQSHMGRPGDRWTTVQGFRGRTSPSGAFRFTYRAPGMFGIRFRVKAGSHTSPARTFDAKTQDVTISLTGQEASGLTGLPGLVVPGVPFGITVDTAPTGIFRSPQSDRAPVFVGRGITLLERIDGDSWAVVGRTTADSRGRGRFPGLTVAAGTHVYKARMDAVTSGGNAIGWTQSFPFHVLAGLDAQAAYEAVRRAAPSSVAVTPSHTGGPGVAATPNAAAVQGWWPVLWDFDWEEGQSLTSPPGRGPLTRVRWADYSDGSGRVVKHNGGLLLDSKRYNGAGYGDFGTTRATAVDAGRTRGRWEARMRVRSAYERGGNTYRILAELVPARPADYACGARNITIASITPFTRTFTYGARTATTRWSGTGTATNTPVHASDAYGIELTGKRITWFLNGRPIGTVTARAAQPRVPMTLRFSLEGKGQQEMDQASLISDWQRAFPIATGRHPVSRHRLPAAATAVPAC